MDRDSTQIRLVRVYSILKTIVLDPKKKNHVLFEVIIGNVLWLALIKTEFNFGFKLIGCHN